MFFGDFCNMSPLNTNDLNRIFQKLDKNGDGLLSVEDLNWLLERIGIHLSLEELESSIGKSSLNLDEFLLFCESITGQNDDEKTEVQEEEKEEEEEEEDSDLVKAFQVFDSNGDGYITCEELQGVLSRLGLWDENSGKDCRSMICKYDTNLDGVVDFEEFKNMMLYPSS